MQFTGANASRLLGRLELHDEKAACHRSLPPVGLRRSFHQRSRVSLGQRSLPSEKADCQNCRCLQGHRRSSQYKRRQASWLSELHIGLLTNPNKGTDVITFSCSPFCIIAAKITKAFLSGLCSQALMRVWSVTTTGRRPLFLYSPRRPRL